MPAIQVMLRLCHINKDDWNLSESLTRKKIQNIKELIVTMDLQVPINHQSIDALFINNGSSFKWD